MIRSFFDHTRSGGHLPPPEGKSMHQQVSFRALSGAVAVIVATNADERRAHCAWCWKNQHPNEPYPREWSSTICAKCEAEVQADIARVKAKRAAAQVAKEAQA